MTARKGEAEGQIGAKYKESHVLYPACAQMCRMYGLLLRPLTRQAQDGAHAMINMVASFNGNGSISFALNTMEVLQQSRSSSVCWCCVYNIC